MRNLDAIVLRRLASMLVGLAPFACSSSASPPLAPQCVEPAKGLPDDVFCTGLYANGSSAQHAPSAMAYTPGVTLWSDGAEKHRYFYLPPGATIDTTDFDAWKFPVGTKVWKEFRVDGTLIETRLLRKRTEKDWDVGTYIWDSTGKTATLNKALKGIVLDNGYEIPTEKDCGKCHHGASDVVLGIEALALALPTAEGATLADLVARGALSNPPAQTSVELPEDQSGKAAQALGYLHANCGMPCHSTRGLGEETKLVLRLRAAEVWPDPASRTGAVPVAMTDTYLSTVLQAPTTAAVAQQFPGAQRITPGAHDKSLVWVVSHLRGNYQMPPLVSHRVDEVGMQQVADWIDTMPTVTRR